MYIYETLSFLYSICCDPALTLHAPWFSLRRRTQVMDGEDMVRSKQAAQKLFDMGYIHVYEFGGINEWTGETQAGGQP